MAQALDGIRILDLSWGIAGPLGVLLLAEHGADVIKVEPPGGDPLRAYDGAVVWNRSRRSIVADLRTDDGREVMEALVRSADVVVESYRPGVIDRLGFGADRIAELNPRCILMSVPAYPDGHRWAQRPGYDALVQASSGQMWEQPGWRMGPIFLHMPMPSMGTAYLVPLGILSALHARHTTGRGQHVRTSLFQGALLYSTQIWQDVEGADAQFHELMGKSWPPGIHQQMIFECANGEYLHNSVMSGLTPTASQDEILGIQGAPDALTFMTLPVEEREIWNAKRRETFKDWDRSELVELMRANNHAVEPVIEASQMFAHPQTIANGLTVHVDDPVHGRTTQMGVPIHLLSTPGEVKGPQPRVGEHGEEILRSLGFDDARVAALLAGACNPTAPAPEHTPSTAPTVAPRLRRHSAPARVVDTPAPAQTALGDITVLDFGQYLAGPFGPMILSDLGATVIKIEPVTGDGMRLASKPFFGCQRGKRSLALNVKDPAGLEVAHRLIGTADVVHQNMTRGVASKLGIDYAASRALRDDIIYCNTYAYGLPDPLGHFGGLDPLYQANSGLEFEAGATHTGNAPLYYRFGMCDASNALLSIVGVLLALQHRDATGEGQELWTSLHDGGVIFSSDMWLGPDGTPWNRPRLDQDLQGIDALYRLYRTQDDDWICIAARRNDEFAALCTVLGTTELLDDARFASQASRSQHRRQLEAVLEPVFRTRAARFWSRKLDDAGVPNEIPVDTFDGLQVLHDADNVRLGLVAEYEHALLGLTRQFGNLIDFSETPGRIFGPAPLVGQHSREILDEYGFSGSEVDDLIASGVVAEPDADLVQYRARYMN